MKIAIALVIALFAIAPAKAIIETFDSPAGDIAGLGWEDGVLWATDAMTNEIFKIDPSSGSVLDSFATIIPSGYHATGLAVQNDIIYVGAWDNGTNGYVFKHDYDGNYIGGVNMCGG
jgi:glutamine cyclotransferase